MSLTAVRQAAFGARRIYTVGSAADRKRGPKGESDVPADQALAESDKNQDNLEPHWQAAIDSATD